MKVAPIRENLDSESDKEKQTYLAQIEQIPEIEALATLAGGIAHEYNNALVGITGNIDLLEMDFPENPIIEKYVKPIRKSANKMANLTNQLLAYACGGKYQPKTISLKRLIENSLILIKRKIDPTILVETDLLTDNSNIKADYRQMQMVLSGIVANAAEAIEKDGIIRITITDKEIEKGFAESHVGVESGPYVCMSVEDNGKGMSDETRNKMFEPFFSTKFHGRGLGMAAAYGIVKNHRGFISVDTEQKKGTVIRIYLPLVEAQITETRSFKAEPAYGTGTILVVEDEDLVIDAIRNILEKLGYKVLEAKSGREALEISVSYKGSIDLAILDVKLPDIGGEKVYPLIKEVRPDLKVIVCSGYSVDGPAQGILDAGAQAFIQKPFALSYLAEKVKELLEDKPDLRARPGSLIGS